MVKFLRYIRKSFLEQNKIRSYLLYALGEIILVVVGILIALQVNNWNQNRIANKERLELLNQLLWDFNVLISAIEEEKLASKNRLIYNKRLLNYAAGTEDIPTDSLQFLLQGIVSYSELVNFKTTLDQAKSSGKLSLIKSDSLFNALSALEYSFNGHSKIGESILRIMATNDYGDILVRSDLLKSVDQLDNLGYSISADMHPDLDLKTSGEAFFRNEETYKSLYQIHITNTINHLWLLSIESNVNNVLNFINKELKP
ncbi:DUF6090 family protein [Algoriphagus halophilus]|uniref:Uncharacterized protein n=1 Tax=Algoriphagus halophilus TaxID=226505 RepID=A0A1N6G286_9BACT|nr:DUF6090 family protein [Algoriphagus halophilus]SIO01614.1 hypothetical protein SAMN05444394_2911 [Algoriphagus halophilus]